MKKILSLLILAVAVLLAVLAPTKKHVTPGEALAVAAIGLWVGGNALARRNDCACMRIIPLITEDKIASGGFTHKAIITHEDLTDTDTTQDLTLEDLTAGQFVWATGHKLIADFSSANGTSVTLSLGNGTSPTAYGAAKELQGTEIDYWRTITITPPAGAADQVGETESLLARFLTSGGSSPLLSEYTAGEVHIYFAICDLNKI